MPPSPSMSNEWPGATPGWSSSQVTMSYVLLGVTLTAGGLSQVSRPLSQHYQKKKRLATSVRSIWKMMELIEIL